MHDAWLGDSGSGGKRQEALEAEIWRAGMSIH